MRDRPILEGPAHRLTHADVCHQHRHVFNRGVGGHEYQHIVRAQFLGQPGRCIGCEQIAGLAAERDDFNPLRAQTARDGTANETSGSKHNGARRFAWRAVKICDHGGTCSINPPSS